MKGLVQEFLVQPLLQGILLLKTKKKKNLQGWQEKQVLSIFELPANGKSCGVILDEFLKRP